MNTISEINLSYSNNQMNMSKVSSSEIAYKLFLENWNQDTLELQEEFKVILLNRANNVLGIYNHSKGGVSGTIVDIKLVFAAVLKANASGILIGHNHPSGNINPSENDRRLTKKIVEACKYLDIVFFDHIIVTKNQYYSFRDNSEI